MRQGWCWGKNSTYFLEAEEMFTHQELFFFFFESVLLVQQDAEMQRHSQRAYVWEYIHKMYTRATYQVQRNRANGQYYKSSERKYKSKLRQ